MDTLMQLIQAAYLWILGIMVFYANPGNTEDDPNSPYNPFHVYRITVIEYLQLRDKIINDEINYTEARQLKHKYSSYFSMLKERQNYMYTKATASFYTNKKPASLFEESMISSFKIVIVCMVIKWVAV